MFAETGSFDVHKMCHKKKSHSALLFITFLNRANNLKLKSPVSLNLNLLKSVTGLKTCLLLFK